jgi:hypothetical protein
MHADLTETIRRHVAATFVELGLSRGAEPRETILIREGAYCGRRFDAEDGHAVWFIEEGQVKFYRVDGSLARSTQPLEGEPLVSRKAA